MKTGIFCIAAGAASLALAQPLAGQPHHRHNHAKRDLVYLTDIVTATAPNVIVYVDANGNPVSTTTEGQAAATSAPAYDAPTYAAPSSAPAPTTYSDVETSAAPASTSYVQTSAASSSASPSSSSVSSSGSSAGYGIVYTPYNDDNTCKSSDQVNADFAAMGDSYGLVRIYGTDCNQVANVLSAAASKGMKIFAGVYDVTQVESEVETIISAAQGNWDAIDTVSIGNEGVQMGTYSVSAVVDAIGTARTKLQAAGYGGKVVTVDTAGMLIANPELCQASDFAAANCHAFFNADLDASGAGEYVLSQAQQVSQACGGMETMITESGWPWKGDANGAAVPSPENQSAAIASLKQSFSSNIILFTAFNDYWKSDNSGTFGAEKYWGILGNAP